MRDARADSADRMPDDLFDRLSDRAPPDTRPRSCRRRQNVFGCGLAAEQTKNSGLGRGGIGESVEPWFVHRPAATGNGGKRFTVTGSLPPASI